MPGPWARLICLTGSLLLGAGRWTAAQTISRLPQTVPAPELPGFLTRSDFSLELALLWSSDPRFTADGVLHADIDVLDSDGWRANLLVDYEGVLGGEHRPFELNHGNYVLETSLSHRFGAVELSGVYHHVSRHLNDQPAPGSISWNALGGRVSRQWLVKTSTIDGQIDLGYAYEPHFVDYTWITGLGIAVRRPVNDVVGLFAGGHGDLLRVNGEVRDHGPCGARLEAGVHLRGRVTAVEVFAAYERRIDGFPTERQRVRISSFGIRFTNR